MPPIHLTVYDCAIIGGGVAGLCLAIQLAKTGCKVVVLEKEKYPFHKVCGEYISMESYGFLKRLGVPLEALKVAHISEVLVSAPDGRSLTRPLGLGGFGISRYTLDQRLAQLAVQLGAELRENTKATQVTFENDRFTLHTEAGSLQAKTVCGAWGRRANLDVKMGRSFVQKKPPGGKNYVGVKYHIRTPFPDNRIELHNFAGGYCGISNVDGGRTCLCYLTDSANLKNNGNSIPEMEEKVLQQNPYLKRYFTTSEFLYEQPLAVSQVTFQKKAVVENHVLMLGDAAGAIAPLCGNGMSMGMHASLVLHALLQRYLSGEIDRHELEQRYTGTWNSLFGTRILAGRTLQQLFGKPGLTNAAISLLGTIPTLTDSLIKLTHGKPF